MDAFDKSANKLTDIEYITLASECEAKEDYEGMFSTLSAGISYNIQNYELYFSLGFFYLPQNVNQAYLCFQNALHYCERQISNNPSNSTLITDREQIIAAMEEISSTVGFAVRKTAIIIVTYNALYLQQKCIESIRETLPSGSYKIICVDNVSTDGCREWLRQQPDISLIENSNNVGFSPACNIGANGLEDYDIFLLNNDTRLCYNSLFWLKMGLYESDIIGATGAYSNYAGNNQQIDLLFDLPSNYVDYGNSNNVPLTNPYEERVRLSGFAMLIKAGLWSLTGGMDESFAPGYFEDDDLSMKILSKKKKLILCKNSFIYHAGSQSFSKTANADNLLLSHYQLFKSKYRFDILKYCEPDFNLLSQIKYRFDDSFNVLVIGSGLGAEIMQLRTSYPNANIIGLEKDQNMFNISSNVCTVFNSARSMSEAINSSVFMLVMITESGLNALTNDDLTYINRLCVQGCHVIKHENSESRVFFDKIKLVVWDLDDTFWKGTLSEGPVEEIPINTNLVIALTELGIINSISSKNDEKNVLFKLNDMDITGAFVFNNINWMPKGPQMAQKIKTMNLRNENVLFIDDNPRNLAEASFNCPGIMTAEPDIIAPLAQYVAGKRKSDIHHTRLNQYKLLEVKTLAKQSYDSADTFLRNSNIRIHICDDCITNLSRIVELLNRSNQLNYTKERQSAQELELLLTNPKMHAACIFAIDNYGDYGLVGFYCLDTSSNKLIHFLFSCRIIGMGIEQFIFARLNFPKINIIGPISCQLSSEDYPDWIEVLDTYAEYKKLAVKQSPETEDLHILVKGPCDLDSVAPLIKSRRLTKEFTYVNSLGFVTTSHNHTAHLVNALTHSEGELATLIESVPFLVRGDFDTAMFNEQYDIVCFSLLTDCEVGLYKRKKDGILIAFGNRNYDITNPGNTSGYINGTIPTNGFSFTPEIISTFSNEWEYVGGTSPELLISNLNTIISNLKGNPHIILTLGSELEYSKSTDDFKYAAKYHKAINPTIRAWANGKDNISLIDFTNLVDSEDDYIDCVNHFTKKIYVRIADLINRIIAQKAK